MKITLKMFASLTAYLPPGAHRHEVELDVPEGTTPAAIIDRLNVPRELTQLVLIGGVFVAPDQRDKRVLNDNEVLAIFPPVAGG